LSGWHRSAGRARAPSSRCTRDPRALHALLRGSTARALGVAGDVKVALLSGGVGGARFARGLQAALGPGELTVIGNVGDDVEVLGLHVSPDLDSVLYALADLHDEERGWGRAGESWNALESVAAWGGERWFRLGDLDIGLHLVRTQALRAGEPLSAVTARLAAAAGVGTRIVPATDDLLRTHVVTPAGTFGFQEWFVGRGHRDEVDDVVFAGASAATPAPGAVEALREADAILIAPSNPYVSIQPILAVGAIRDALASRTVRCVAVSPLIGGRAVKGPADRMLSRMAGGTTPRHVADRYGGLIDALVVDASDAHADADVATVATSTLMTDLAAARRLAEVALEAAA
jgi:LPPG:FO 2-phospho-L-lactate transferase